MQGDQMDLALGHPESEYQILNFFVFCWLIILNIVIGFMTYDLSQGLLREDWETNQVELYFRWNTFKLGEIKLYLVSFSILS